MNNFMPAATYRGKRVHVVKFFETHSLVVNPATGSLTSVHNDDLTLHIQPQEAMHQAGVEADAKSKATVEELSAPASGKRVDLDFSEGLSMGQSVQ